MSRKTVSCLRVVLLAVLALVCLLAVGMVGLMDIVPKEAARRFGRPAANLSQYQRVMYSLRLMSQEQALTKPVDPNGTLRPFNIALGESVSSIATHLEMEGLIHSAEAFRTYLVYAGLDTGVQAGNFQLSPGMTAMEIAHALLDPVPEDVQFNILPGWRAEEIADALPTSGIEVSPADFLELVRNPPDDLLPRDAPGVETLEGFLAPGSYVVKRRISTRDLLVTFINRFDETITADLREGFAAQGLDVAQAVTLASIIEREAIVSEEQPVIASVFYNRLAIGMKLESDPTVQYALGYQPGSGAWWKNPLSSGNLQVDSRYNTYVYPGLPPSPIASPGIDALRAAAYPAQTGFYFFRAQCDGSGRHFFAETYEQHLNNACP